jgi:hypothetical protein
VIIKLVARKHEVKSRVRHFRRRFEDTIIVSPEESGSEGIKVVCLVRDNDQWGALMNIVINFWVL